MENRTESIAAAVEVLEPGAAPVSVVVAEFRNHYVVEMPFGGLDPDEVDVSVTSRIVTIRSTASGPDAQRRSPRTIGSVFLDGPVNPSSSYVFCQRGKLYLNLRKDPMASAHVPLSLKIAG